jgi:hypothetical protein
VINSSEIQSAINPQKDSHVYHTIQKKNPLKNRRTEETLNPNAKIVREAARKANE